MIFGGIIIVLAVVYLMIFGKGSDVKYIYDHKLAGITLKDMLRTLDGKFLKAWRKAHEAGQSSFKFSNGITYNTTFPPNGRIISPTYGRTQ